MLNRLLFWWRRRRQQKHRGIFHYWDGQRERAADPFEILRAIADDPEYSDDREPKLMLVDDFTVSDEAAQKTVRCVRRAFGVKSFNEGGLLEAECLDLIDEFYGFLGALKKNTSPSPISSEPTQMSSTVSTGEVPTPGKSSSDLPGTQKESN